VERPALWEALKAQGVELHYIGLLKELYTGQIGHIQAGVLNKEFKITRGTK